MAWNTPVVHAVGDVLTASDWNITSADLAFLFAPPTARVFTSSSVFPANNTLSDIPFNAVNYNAAGCWSSGNASRLTAVVAGTYAITAQVGWTPSTAGTLRDVELIVNGATGSPIGENLRVAPGGAGYCIQPLSTHWFFNVGDYVELWVKQDTGSTLGCTCVMTCARGGNG